MSGPLGLGLGMWSQRGGTPTPAPTPAPTITPDAGWTGTAGQVSPPALDTSLQGSGWIEKVSGAIAEQENIWIGYDGIEDELVHTITVGMEHSDPAAGAVTCNVYCETASPLVITTETWNPRTSTWGFNFTPLSRTGVNGEARITVDLVPTNGYIRRFVLNVTLNTSATNKIVRPVRYLSPTGTDQAAPTGGSQAAPWKTLNYAAGACTDAAYKGALIYMAAGDYVEFDNNGNGTQNSNTRAMTFLPDAGVVRSDINIRWQSRTLNSQGRGAGIWQLRADKVEFYNVQIETKDMTGYWARQSSNCRHWFRKCRIYDANGIAGPVDSNTAWNTAGGARIAAAPMYGTGYYGSPTQSFFKNTDGQRIGAIESIVEMYVMTTFSFLRNIEASVAYDVLYLHPVAGGNDNDGFAYFNVRCQVDQPYVQRGHEDSFLTIADAIFDGTAATGGALGRTILIPQGTPVLGGPYSQLPFTAAKFLTGANIGRSSGSGSNDESAGYGGFHWYNQNASKSATFASGNSQFTCNQHFMVPNTPVVITGGSLPPEFTSGNTYYVLSSGFGPNAMRVATTPGGTAIVPSTAGSGTVSCPNVIIVEGDCSIATGGTVVGDQIRVYQVAHCDGMQLDSIDSTKGNVDNLFLDSFQVTGPHVGNIGLWSGGKNGYPAAVTLTTTGTSFTASGSVGIVADNLLKITSGARKGETARVVSYNSGTFTGVLAAPFPGGDIPAGTAFGNIRTYRNVTMRNCIFSTYGNGSFLQWGDGMLNVIMRGCTIIGRETGAVSNVGDILYRVLWQNTPLGGSACYGWYVNNCLFEAVTLDSTGGGSLPGANEKVNVINSHVRRGSSFMGTSVGDATFNTTTYLPTFVGSPVLTTLVGKPAFCAPSGSPTYRTASSPVGAVA